MKRRGFLSAIGAMIGGMFATKLPAAALAPTDLCTCPVGAVGPSAGYEVGAVEWSDWPYAKAEEWPVSEITFTTSHPRGKRTWYAYKLGPNGEYLGYVGKGTY